MSYHFSAPINLLRYSNGTLVKLTASAHEFIAYEYYAQTRTGLYSPEQITINARYEGDVSFGKWQYSLDGINWQDLTATEGIIATEEELIVLPSCSLFGESNSAITFKLIGDDNEHYDTATITKTIDPVLVYVHAQTAIEQTNRRIALIASEEQLQQFSTQQTLVTKVSSIEETANGIVSTVTANYATKVYAQEQATEKAGAAQSAAAADATAKANQAEQNANDATDAKLADYSTTVQMQSMIQQTADAINLSVSQTYATVTAAQGYADTAEQNANDATDAKLANYSTTVQMNSAIQLAADAINLSVIRRETGDVNLIAVCNATRGYLLGTGEIQANANSYYYTSALIPVTENEILSFQVWPTDPPYSGFVASNPVAFYNSSGAIISGSWTANSGALENKKEITITAPAGAAYVRVCWFYTAAAMLSRGPYFPNFCQAAADITNNLATNYSTTTETQSLIQQSADAITATVSRTYATTTQAQGYASDAESAANSATDQKLTGYPTKTQAQGYADTAEQNANDYTDGALASYSTTVQVQSMIQQSADAINLSVQQTIANSATGSAINLIADCHTETGYVNAQGVINAYSSYRSSEYISVKPGDKLVFQLWNPSNANLWTGYTVFDSEKAIAVASHNGRYSTDSIIKREITIPDGVAYLRVSYAAGYKVKLERGSTATEWSQAPEDLETSFSSLQVSVNSISSTVSQKVGSTEVVSLIQQNADSIRLKADKLIWSATNSSMDENGNLTARGATFYGSDIYLGSDNNTSHIYAPSGNGNVMGIYAPQNISLTTTNSITLWVGSYSYTFYNGVIEINDGQMGPGHTVTIP